MTEYERGMLNRLDMFVCLLILITVFLGFIMFHLGSIRGALSMTSV